LDPTIFANLTIDYYLHPRALTPKLFQFLALMKLHQHWSVYAWGFVHIDVIALNIQRVAGRSIRRCGSSQR
jgi:hypothetical protein